MKIVITGGGTGGHIFPALAVAQKLRERGHELMWIGDRRGLEREITQKEQIKFAGIFTGKLRRYWDWQNFGDALKVVYGWLQARAILKKIRPAVVFSKGGFVSVPVALAARTLKIPVVTHESDATPGLATRIIARWARAEVCASFKSVAQFFPTKKVHATGTPVAEHFWRLSRQAARAEQKLAAHEKLVTIFGGSQGALAINQIIFQIYKKILGQARVVHQVGSVSWEAALEAKKKLPAALQSRLEIAKIFTNHDLARILKASDVVISRAGATTLAELAALGSAAVLVPLPTLGSRGDQLDNAQFLEKMGAAAVIAQENLTAEILWKTVAALLKNQEENENLRRHIKKFAAPDAAAKIVKIVEKAGAPA